MSSIKIKSISLKKYKCFEDVVINCEKNDETIYQWTILLGNNNTGKTNILKAIAGMRPKKYNFHKTKGKQEIKDDFMLPTTFVERMDRGLGSNTEEEKEIITLKLRNFPHAWNCSTVSASIDRDCQLAETFNIFGYGVSRYPSKTNLVDSLCDDCATLFSTDQRLVNIEEWLMQLDYSAKSKNVAARYRLEKIKELIKSGIFPEILDFKFENKDAVQNHVLFKSKDGWYQYTELGFGYQSMLAWVIDLAKRLFEKFPQSENPFREEAVVLIDEIDLHLHPQWQRDVISVISSIFPNIQFIATTHSPLVIQSLEEVNLYTLNREENDRVVVKKAEKTNYSGWTVEEILRYTMGLDNNVQSNVMQKYQKIFEEGLNEEDVEKAKDVYDKLKEIIHPNNPLGRILDIQLNQLVADK